MKKLLLVAMLLIAMLIAITACQTSPHNNETTVGEVSDTEPGEVTTEAQPDTNGDVTEAPTEDITEVPTEEPTDEIKGWTPDTGKFNEGIVDYEVVVETIVEGVGEVEYPDKNLGKLMSAGEIGVKSLFSKNFAAGDTYTSAEVMEVEGWSAATTHRFVIEDGALYFPYDESADTKISAAGWTGWSPRADASVQKYKQAQLSLTWTPYAVASNQPWLLPFIACYCKTQVALPTSSGNGLYLTFNAQESKIHVYNPANYNWAAGWTAVDVEPGILNGKIQTDILTSSDYSTYVYITPENGERRLVLTVLFQDGKIRLYNEAGDLVAEDTCSTDNLSGGYFSFVTHGGGGFKIEDVEVLVATKGEVKVTEITTVKATPTEGNSLGLDITNKTDLVGIYYSIWFDNVFKKSGGYVDSWYNVTEVLAGNQEWGGQWAFHYWAKPALGYYCSSNKDVIRTHMTQLYNAGVDFIILDHTNINDSYLSNEPTYKYMVHEPFVAIFDTIMEMRAEGLGTPYVVAWYDSRTKGALYEDLYYNYYNVDKWKDCFVYWDGMPFLMLDCDGMPADYSNPCPEFFTTRYVGGLMSDQKLYEAGVWNFLHYNNYNKVSLAADGSPEQMTVCVASQETWMSNTSTAHGRQGGMLWYAQWRSAFQHHPKIVTLTWWNEWVAQRGYLNDQYFFVDNYNQEYSRDIEPMEGGHGDQYYQWMIQYISAYKGGLECPVLIEEEYEDDLDMFIKKYERGRN